MISSGMTSPGPGGDTSPSSAHSSTSNPTTARRAPSSLRVAVEALDVQLAAPERARIDEVVPAGAAAGDRCNLTWDENGQPLRRNLGRPLPKSWVCRAREVDITLGDPGTPRTRLSASTPLEKERSADI
jgi:hypothetical protein